MSHKIRNMKKLKTCELFIDMIKPFFSLLMPKCALYDVLRNVFRQCVFFMYILFFFRWFR